MTDKQLDTNPLASLEPTTTQALHQWLIEHGVVLLEPVSEARNLVYRCTVVSPIGQANNVRQYLKRVSSAELQILKCLSSSPIPGLSFRFSRLIDHIEIEGEDWVLLSEVTASKTIDLNNAEDISALTKGLTQFHQRGFDVIPIQHKLPHLLGGWLKPSDLEALCIRYFIRGGQIMYDVIADSIESDVHAPHVLLHGDLTHANVFISEHFNVESGESKESKESRVGFIDFEYVSIGNPLWDLGMMVIELAEARTDVSGPSLIKQFDDLLESYRQQGGVISPEQLETAWAWMVCYWLVAKEWAETNHQPTATYRRIMPAVKEIVRLYTS